MWEISIMHVLCRRNLFFPLNLKIETSQRIHGFTCGRNVCGLIKGIPFSKRC